MIKGNDYWDNLLVSAGLAGGLDLAVEANELLRGSANQELPGVAEEVRQSCGVIIHIITVLNEQGEAALGRPRGRYITLDIPPAESEETIAGIAAVTAEQLGSLLPSPISLNRPLLVVGLGNDHAIADALGPRVIALTYATRHIFRQGQKPAGLAPLSAIAPGVLGNSGIETAEIIMGICEHIHPAALIVVDSLAAASVTRVGTTIQIADTGIKPGSGIGNRRSGIDAAMAGCPVIAIGVPTVVDTASIICETVKSLDDYWQGKAQLFPTKIDEGACRFAEKQLLERFRGQLMVTPKDIDELIAADAEIIAAAIAIAVHPGADTNNYLDFIR